MISYQYVFLLKQLIALLESCKIGAFWPHFMAKSTLLTVSSDDLVTFWHGMRIFCFNGKHFCWFLNYFTWACRNDSSDIH